MTARTPLAFAISVVVLGAGAAGPAAAQLNLAYDEGYDPMLDLAGSLKELVDSETERQDHAAVRDLGDRYVRFLDRVVAGLENIGRNFREGDNESWARATKSEPLAAARNARTRAETLRARGEARTDCLAAAIDLQKALAELSDEFKDCWKAHEERRQKLQEAYDATRERWWAATREDRRPLDALDRRVTELANRRNELQSRATAAARLFISAQDQCDRARTELYGMGRERSPDEVRSRYEAWIKAEDLVKRVGEAARAAEREAADADRAHLEAWNEYQRAMETYVREATEGDALYKLVLERHTRAFEMAQEYRPFSW